MATGILCVAYSAAPIQRDGVVTGVVVGFRDVTARRRAEEALAQSEARHRLLLDALPDAILVVDGEGFVRYANPAASDLFGRPAEMLVGANLGVPALDSRGVVVDVTTAGGTWRRAHVRTVRSTWENTAAYISIYWRKSSTSEDLGDLRRAQVFRNPDEAPRVLPRE